MIIYERSTSYYNTESGQYNWTVPNLSTTSALIRITDSDNPSVFDISDINFSMTAPVILLIPDGGEIWQGGTYQTIQWASNSTSQDFELWYSNDAEGSWNFIGDVTTTTYSYDWLVPNEPGNQFSIKVNVEGNRTCMVDNSENLFTVIPATPVITVTNPDGGETFYIEKPYNITWSNQYVTTSLVKIDFSINNGETWIPIVTSTDNDGIYSWTVPDYPSTECLVRVTDLTNATTYGESPSTFRIKEPYIAITYPNGGKTIEGCYSESITWVAGGTSGTYKVEYSVNNGTTWTTILSGISGASYSYKFPNTPSTECLIRVSDADNPNTMDTVNSTFSVIKNNDIVITSPDGGEELEVGSQHTVNWASASSSTKFTVQYSVDGGSWASLINGTTVKYYNWTVANAPSDNVKILVYDYNNSCINDESDAPFSIVPVPPVLTYPDGGETFYYGSSYTITWTDEYIPGELVSLEYSSDSGATWKSIITATENDGAYSWLVPKDVSNKCLVKIRDITDTIYTAISQAVFTIAKPWINLTSHDGGELYTGCYSNYINWTYGGLSGSFKLEYSVDEGETWKYITTTTSSYNWKKPDITEYNCLVKITNVDYPEFFDVSEAPFGIEKNDDIMMIDPVDEEELTAGQTKTISWASAPSSSTFGIGFFDGYGSSTQIVNYTASKTMNWTVPNTPCQNCYIKVYDYNNTCINAKVDINILPGDAVVFTPNAAIDLYAYSTYSITWEDEYYYSDYVRIELSLDNGSSWESIANVTENDGTYSWIIPDSPSVNCLIKVSSFSDPMVYDVSDNTFAIKDGVRIITPNGDGGGSEWRSCTETTISWEAGGTSNYYKLEFSSNNGNTWSTITSSYYSTGTKHTYDWILPNVASENCLVKVSDKNNVNKVDVSDYPFTLTPSITIISPNGAEALANGTPYNIIWDANGTSNYYDIAYSIDGGTTWTDIVSNENIINGTYSWNPPAVISSNCKIKVVDHVNTCKTDVNDTPFSIGEDPSVITITTPAENDVINGCTSQTVSWTTENTSGIFNLYYSIDGGENWISIMNGYTSATNEYTWTVPNINSETCLIKVVDAVNNYISGNSKSFEVSSVIADAGTDQNICAGSSVALLAGGGVSYSWSPSDGLSATDIANPLAAPTSTTQYTVTVTDVNGCTDTDVIEVTVYPIPAAPVLSSNSPVITGGKIQLFASTVTGATYYWIDPAGFTSIKQNPEITNATLANTGNYEVVATVNGCKSVPADIDVVVNTGTAIANISGAIYTTNGVAVGQVDVTLDGPTSDTVSTGSDGLFELTATYGGTYVLRPQKPDGDVTTGISTLDILLMQRHILDIAPLPESYQVIAGDVNESGELTTLDIVHMRSVLLRNTDQFPTGAVWKFVNSDFIFATPSVPFPYEENRSYSSITSAHDQDFIAVKLGDVNNSWNALDLKNTTYSELSVEFQHGQVVNGILAVPVLVHDFEDISGMQYTISWNTDKLNFISIENRALQQHYGPSTNGNMRVMWTSNDAYGVNLEDGTQIAILKFTVLATLKTGDISLNSNLINAEAYTGNLTKIDVTEYKSQVLSIDGKIIDTESISTSPNPFTESVSIEATFKLANKVTVRIVNVNGTIVWSRELPAIDNSVSFKWNAANNKGVKLPTGIYYISLVTESGIINTSVILID